MARPKKRSLTLQQHRTSVTLEDEFWDEFCLIACHRGTSINALASRIDNNRDPDTGLATAIRLFVFADLRARLKAQENT